MEIEKWIEFSKWMLGSYLVVGILSGVLAMVIMRFARRYGDIFLSPRQHQIIINADLREIFCLAVVIWPAFLAKIIAGGINGARGSGP